MFSLTLFNHLISRDTVRLLELGTVRSSTALDPTRPCYTTLPGRTKTKDQHYIICKDLQGHDGKLLKFMKRNRRKDIFNFAMLAIFVIFLFTSDIFFFLHTSRRSLF